MKSAVDILLDLEVKFGVNHFHKGLREDIVSDEFKNFLNSLVFQPARHSIGLPAAPVFVEKHKSAVETHLAIETVQVAPDPALFFGETNANLLLLAKQLSAFRKEIPDMYAFTWMLRRHCRKLKDIFRVKPELALDFQALLDTEGNLYWIDVDGHINLSMKLRKDQIICRAQRALATFKDVMLNLTETKIIQIEYRQACH